MKKLSLLLVVLSVLITIQSCKKKEDEAPTPQPGEVIVADITKVLDIDTRDAINNIDTNDYTFTYYYETDLLAGLQPGDILVDSASDFARYGYLRKVTSINNNGDMVVVSTEPAGLTEAVLQGSIDFKSGMLKTSQLSEIILTKGVTLSQQKGSDFTVFDIKYNLDFGSGNNSVNIAGNTSLGMEVFFDFDWSYQLLPYPAVLVDLFETGVEVNQSASINMISEGEANIPNEPVSLATFYFEPWTFSVGPVPVVFVPKVELFISIDGSITAEFSTGASESFTGRLGTKYTSANGWSEIAEKTFNYNYYPPQVDISASIGASVGPEISLMLYGVVGPFVNFMAYSDLEAELHSGTNNWDLDYEIGVNAETGVKIDILIFEEEWSVPFNLFKHTLMHLDNEPMETGVYFKNPEDESVIAIGGDINLEARVTGATPEKLEFFVDGILIGEIYEDPWSLNWNSAQSALGSHEFIILDYIGNEIVASDTITIQLVEAVWESMNLSNYGQGAETVNHDVFFTNNNEGWLAGGSAYGFGGYLLHTSDGGQTWENLAEDQFLISVYQMIYMNDSEILLATADGEVLSSKTWSPLKYSTGTNYYYTFDDFDVRSIAMSASGYIYAPGNFILEDSYKIFKVKAASDNYEPEGTIDINHKADDYTALPKIYFQNNKGIVYNLKDNDPSKQYIMISDDGGNTWSDISINASGIDRADIIHNAFFINDNTGFLVGQENDNFRALVLKTTDGGNSWVKTVVDEAANFSSVYFIDNETGYASVNSYSIEGEMLPKLFKTADGGITWNPVNEVSTINTGMKKVFFRGPYLGFTIGSGAKIYKYSSGK